RLGAAQKGMAAGAAAHAALPPAGSQVAAAQDAVKQPPQETAGRAAEALTKELGEQPEPGFEVEEFIRTIREELRNRRPKNEQELAAADPKAAARGAGEQIN